MLIKKSLKREQFGPVTQKILLLLSAGFSLSLAYSPKGYSRINRDIVKEWEKINQQSLKRAISRLYESKLIDYEENEDGTILVVLNGSGKKRALRYNLDTIKIDEPDEWDGLWRIVIFDVPENMKRGRDVLAEKLKQLGFEAIQKSVFVFPYECQNEIDFIVEVFNLRPYVRTITAKEIDIDLDLRHKFKLK